MLGAAIRNFINDGGIYITAAGNNRKSLYSGITSIGSGYHIFPDGKDYLEFVLDGSDYLYLQWSTSWTNPSIDLDFEAVNTTTNTTYYSQSNQSFTIPPIENLDLTEPGVYRLKIKKRVGNEVVEFKILSLKGKNIQNNNTNQIFGHSAYPNVICVAAYQANDENATSDYSSIGPALMYSTAIQQWTVQEVPTITATSGVETWVGSTGLWSDGDPVFDGTSASAPHIAGLAALYFHKLNGIEGKNKSNIDFKNDLTLSATTLEIGMGGIWNNKSGFGKANILNAIGLALNAVTTPTITPLGGIYNSPQLITITCATENASIYYTDDGSDPSQSSTLYTGQFWINSDKTIKARAFKEGFLPSMIATESYIIGSSPISVMLTPASGIYPYGKKVQAYWPSEFECWYTYTKNGPEPPSPESINGNNLLIPPRVLILAENAVWRVKFQLYKPGVGWQPTITYVQYDIRPELRIAQIDDEIPETFGFWNKWESNQWNPHPDETIIRPTIISDWYLKALQDFKDPVNNVFRKYNVWSTNLGTNYFVNHAKIPVGPNTSSILAHFKQTYDMTVMNKIENIFSVDQGSFIFKNPWIVDDNSDSKGPRNRGDGTILPQIPYTINFSTSPNITTGSIHKGVFLNQGYNPVNNTWQPPYYSVKADAVQDIYLPHTDRTHKFYFQGWSASPEGSAEFQNANALETPVVFKQEGATVQANLKGTQLSNNSLA